MAITYAAITGKITAPGGTTGIRARVEFIPETADGVIAFPGDGVTQGAETRFTSATDGTLTEALQIPVSGPAAGAVWRVVVTPLDRGPNGHTLAPWTRRYTVTGDTRLDQLVETDVLAVTPTLVTSVQTLHDETLTARDETVAVGSTNDTIMASRINDAASATTAALRGGYLSVGQTMVNVAAYSDDLAAAYTAQGAGKVYHLTKPEATVSSTITLGDHTHVVGTGRGATVLKLGNSLNTHMLTNADVTNGNPGIHLRGFTLDGNKANNTATVDPSAPKYGIHLHRCGDLTIEDFEVKNVRGTGLFLTGDATQTRVVQLSNVYAHDNDLDGIWVGNAMREVYYDGVFGRLNARHGVVIDHSEAVTSAVDGYDNGEWGIWVRNVHGCALFGLSAAINGKHGIYVIGLTDSVGGGWKAFNNGQDVTGQSDVYFDGPPNVITPGYGPTDQAVINGIIAGYNPNWTGGKKTDYGMFIADGLADYNLKVLAFSPQGGALLGDLRYPATSTKLHVSGFATDSRRRTTWAGDEYVRNGGVTRWEGAATSSLPSAASAGKGSLTFDSTLNAFVGTSDGATWVPVLQQDVRLSKTANYSMTAVDTLVEGNGTLTLSLPGPGTVSAGRRYTVKNVGTSLVTVDSQGTSKTIDGKSSVVLGPNDRLVVYSDGNNWQIAAGGFTSLSTKTANYSMTATDELVVGNGTSITISLPGPGTVAIGKRYTVKNVNASSLTVNSQGTSKTIDGAASVSLAQWAKGQYVSDGSNWLSV